MRKYFIGFILGVLLASAFPAYGAITSMVGKQVKAENTVVVNGKELDVKAVNIDGTTYTPNRALAEALEAEIGFEDSKVILNTNVVSTENGGVDVSENQDNLSEEISKIKTEITKLYVKLNELDSTYRSTGITDELQKEADQINQKIKELEIQKETLEAQLEAQTTP